MKKVLKWEIRKNAFNRQIIIKKNQGLRLRTPKLILTVRL